MNAEKGRDAKPTASRKRAGGPTKARTDGSVQAAIGNRLRAYYDEVAREPVPDRFVELLKRLNGEDAGKR